MDNIGVEKTTQKTVMGLAKKNIPLNELLKTRVMGFGVSYPRVMEVLGKKA